MFGFKRRRVFGDDEKAHFVDLISTMLVTQLIPAGQRSLDDATGRINAKALGYIYGFIDAALRTIGQDMGDVAIGVPFAFHVLRRVFPGREEKYLQFLIERMGNDRGVTSAAMCGGHEYIDFANRKTVPTGLARYILEARSNPSPRQEPLETGPGSCPVPAEAQQWTATNRDVSLAGPGQQAPQARPTAADVSRDSETGWKGYASQKEKFSAVFPGDVSRQFFGSLEDDGESAGSVVYSAKSGDGILYEVRVTRVMGYYGSAEEFLKTALVEMASSMTDCAVVRQKSEVFRGCPAIGFEASFRGVMSLCGVVALRERTLYMLSVCFRSGAQHDLPRFLDGFELLRR